MSLLDSIIPSIVNSVLQPTLVGAACAVSVKSAATYSYTTGQETGGTVTTKNIYSSPPQAYSQREIDGTTILTGDMKIYIAAEQWSSLPAAFGDAPTSLVAVAIQGRTYSIIRSTPFMVGESAAAFEVQLRVI